MPNPAHPLTLDDFNPGAVWSARQNAEDRHELHGEITSEQDELLNAEALAELSDALPYHT